jgi:hypothetical protein
MKIAPELQAFQRMNAEVGIELNFQEAKVNYAACATALAALIKHKFSIEYVIECVKTFDSDIREDVVRKFLLESLAVIRENDD